MNSIALIRQQKAAEAYWVGDYKVAGIHTNIVQKLVLFGCVGGLVIVLFILLRIRGAG